MTVKRILLIFSLLLTFSVALKAQAPAYEGNKPIVSSADTFYVSQLVITSAIEDKEAVDEVDSLAVDPEQKVWCYARFYNTDSEQKIKMKWLRNGEEYYIYNATIGTSPRWRTYSSVTRHAGDWEVQILDEAGKVLSQTYFVVE